ncbi:MAG: hypothetical protein GX891_02355 [Clostridiales bacterium]|nr:hypothetical protein [Clostridiales bacterium]
MYCKHCEVEIEGAARLCPLCHRPLDGEAALFPVVIKSKKLSKVTFTATYLIAALIIAVVCLIVNLVLGHKILWSVAVVGLLIYLYILFAWTLFSQRHTATKIFVQTLGLAVMVALMQQLSPEVKWSLNYVVPFIMMLGGILLAIIAFAAKKAGSYIFNLLLVMITGLIPLVYNLIVKEATLWPSIVCVSVCGALFLVHIIISAGNAKNIIIEEIKRKFHL